MQPIYQAIDVTNWRRDEEFAEYPEGTRDKTLLYCSSSNYNFLKHGQRYLFKLSSHRYQEQFWVEILAYLIGIEMDVPVPPTYAAYDSKKNQSGALIEWFLKPLGNEIYIAGGDLCQQLIPDFDRKKGKQHNFQTVSQIFNYLSKKYSNSQLDWKNYWAKALVFDALIGNTDRHQENWGAILTPSHLENVISMDISPVFDNGTSMGHEIPSNKFNHYDDQRYLEKYVSKGCHHMKWNLSDPSPTGHLEMLKKIVSEYPETCQLMLDCLKRVNYDVLKDILDTLLAFDVPIRLTSERAAFMLKLLKFRHQYLLQGLGN